MTVPHRPFAMAGINGRTSAPGASYLKVCSFRLPNMCSFRLPLTMLDEQKMGKRSRRGPATVGSLKRGPRGAMIDWNAVFMTLPNQFTLETMSAHKTAGEKTRACAPG